MEPLLKWKAQYIRPPFDNSFRSTVLDSANIVFFFTKPAILIRRSTVLSIPFQLVFPAEMSGLDESAHSDQHSSLLLSFTKGVL